MNSNDKNSILIVDDEEMNLRVLSAFLCEDYDVRTAGSGTEALKSALGDPPDLILLDVMMPDMDGYEVLAVLKKDEKTRNIPVIFITGLDSKEDEEKGLGMEAADYISKPLSVGIVRLRVKNQMQIINQIRTIEALSLIDQLTGIPNRRNLDNRIAVEWSRAYREKSHISLMMMDIDKFKLFNDTYGHLTGDEVLKLVAGTFELSLKRKSDFAARFGGEEFSVLLPNTDIDGAADIAEDIRKNVEKLVIPCGDGKTTKVTISIGVHSLVPSQGDEIADMIAKADTALYAAKEAGRNRVCVYNEELGISNVQSAMSNKPEKNRHCGPCPQSPADEELQSDKTTGNSRADVLAKVSKIDGINTEIGLSHFQKMENTYIETLEYFCERLPVVTAEMESALAEGDVKKFAISVHSMKSMLSTVGAAGPARMAEKLESAGKSGDESYCRDNYPQLHDKLKKLHAGLSEVFAKKDAEPENTIAADTGRDPGKRKRIIHVDDVNYTLVSLKGRLEKYFEIYSAQSHDRLFKLLEKVTPDLILLDVKIPGMDGFAIIRKLKADTRYAGIPVIFLTSMNDEESISEGKALGAADVITKPVPDAELVKRIEDAL